MANPRVTPLAGVWIEIITALSARRTEKVTPLAGVWIEMVSITSVTPNPRVTPLAGVWIEIRSHGTTSSARASSHTPRGCVD